MSQSTLRIVPDSMTEIIELKRQLRTGLSSDRAAKFSQLVLQEIGDKSANE